MGDGQGSVAEPGSVAGPAAVAPRWRDWALRYLARYAASRAAVRRVLERRAMRYQIDFDAAQVEAVLDDLERIGLLDDRAFGQNRARSLQARGRSLRRIRAELADKGIARQAVDDAVASLGADAEMKAAMALARRRRLGPWRQGEPDRLRELTILARAGFAFGLARRVVDAGSEAEIDQP